MNPSRTQIITTIGPASSNPETLAAMLAAGMDMARLNFSWADEATHEEQIRLLRNLPIHVPIMQDLPGPRVQHAEGHGHDTSQPGFTEHDAKILGCAVRHNLEWVAVSFVSGADDIDRCRAALMAHGGGSQRIIAKIERTEALDRLGEIIDAADAVMVARGDLGNNIPIERVPFVQADIIDRCNRVRKPVIVATQLLSSMTTNTEPTRAEVTDVTDSVLQGADALLLAEETAMGQHPALVVATMEKIILESERHLRTDAPINILS